MNCVLYQQLKSKIYMKSAVFSFSWHGVHNCS